MILITVLGVTGMWCCSITGLAGKTGKEILESSVLDFSENISTRKFALSVAKGNNSQPVCTERLAGLPLFKTVLAIRDSQVSGKWLTPLFY